MYCIIVRSAVWFVTKRDPPPSIAPKAASSKWLLMSYFSHWNLPLPYSLPSPLSMLYVCFAPYTTCPCMNSSVASSRPDPALRSNLPPIPLVVLPVASKALKTLLSMGPVALSRKVISSTLIPDFLA